MKNQPDYTTRTTCRLCQSAGLTDLFSLGTQFVSDFVDKDKVHSGIKCPIDLVLCPVCTLVQLRHTARQDFLYTRHYWYRCIGAGEKIFARVRGWGRLHRDCLVHDTAEKIFSSPYQVDLPCIQRDGSIEWRPILHREVSVQPVYMVEFYTGSRVVASANHRWPRLNSAMEWIPERTTEQLRPKDRVGLVHDMTRPAATVDSGSIYGAEAGYLVGVYLAEGCRDKTSIKLTVHETKDSAMVERIREFVTGRLYEGLSVYHESSKHTLCLYISGAVVNGLVSKFVRGRESKGKNLTPDAWAQPTEFLRGLVDGWLDGDGHYETDQERWRFNICKNTDLVEDMALACRLVGYRMRYRLRKGTGFRGEGDRVSQYAGWVRKSDAKMRQHRRIDLLGCTSVKRVWKQKQPKRTWDVAVGGDELYSLGCGIVTHNSGVTATMRESLRELVREAVSWAKLKKGEAVLDIGSNDSTTLRAYNDLFPELCLYTVGVEPATNLQKEGARGINLLVPDFWQGFATGPDDLNCFYEHETYQEIYYFPKPKIITALGMFYDLENPNQFVADVSRCMADDGIFCAQLMCLRNMLDSNDVGNLCHEHLEFYSLRSLEYLYRKHGLEIFHIEANRVNGGSYRIWAKKVGCNKYKKTGEFERLLQKEFDDGLHLPETYQHLWEMMEKNRSDCWSYLSEHVCRTHKSLYVYGASTKGNVVLQFYDLTHQYHTTDRVFVAGAADRSPEKWGKYTVGTGIPIMSEADARSANPDFFLMLPYAFESEFIHREREWLEGGGKFIIPLPQFRVVGKEAIGGEAK